MKTTLILFAALICLNVSWSQDRCEYICEIPSSYTPNSDGINDLLVAKWDCKPEVFEAKIYNRWGQEIFKTKDPTIQWDALDEDDKSVETGVYIIMLNYEVDGEEVKKSYNFTVIR